MKIVLSYMGFITNILSVAAVIQTTIDLVTAGIPQTSIDLDTAGEFPPGCTFEHEPYIDGENRNFSIPSSGGNRTFSVHLPLDYDPTIQTYPLMISYHGGRETKKVQEIITNFSWNATNPNMIIVYPQGIDDTWEVAPFAASGVDDKVFTSALLNYMESNYCVDTQRVFASGKSDGGGFLAALASNATYGSRFAAFAPVAGAFYTDNGTGPCDHAPAPVPILEFHSRDDRVISYLGGCRHKVPLPPILDWVAGWAVRNGCLDRPSETYVRGPNRKLQYIKETYSCGSSSNVVSHYRSQNKTDTGNQHIWPNTMNGWFNASSLIIDFFNANPKKIII